MIRGVRGIAAWGFVASLAACGGGGGGADSGTATGTDPTVPGLPITYEVGGTVSGLNASGLVLQLNGGDDLAIDLDRSFVFPVPLPANTSYRVSVRQNPAGQTCTVDEGQGVVSERVSSVRVTCITPSPLPSGGVQLRGTVSNLLGTGLRLRQGSEIVAVPAGATAVTFPTPLALGALFSVTIDTQPVSPAQTCVPSGHVGFVSAEVATGLAITCTTDPAAPEAAQLVLDRTEVMLQTEQGEPVAPQTVIATAFGTSQRVIGATSTNRAVLVRVTTLQTGKAQLTLVPKAAVSLAPGVYKDTVTVTACEDMACARPLVGSPTELEVSYTVLAPVGPSVLQTSEQGVAFAQVPTGSALVRTLHVSESNGRSVLWTASSSAPWLAVTAGGTAGGALVLTADPSALSDGFHEAIVTLATTDTAVVKKDTVRVGLYKSASASAAALVDPPSGTWGDERFLADPVRPLVYALRGGVITAHHVYTGARVARLDLGAVNLLRGGVVGRDGRTLYAYGGWEITAIDLDSFSKRYSFPLGSSLSGATLALGRVAGDDVLLANALETGAGTGPVNRILRTTDGKVLGEVDAECLRLGPFLATSRDGAILACAPGAAMSGVMVAERIELRANSLGNRFGVVTGSTPALYWNRFADLAVSGDGQRLALAFGNEPRFRTFRFTGGSQAVEDGPPEDFASTGGNIEPQASLEFDWRDRLLVAKQGRDFRVYEPDGTILHRRAVVTVDATSDGMRVSSDGLRVVGNGLLMDTAP